MTRFEDLTPAEKRQALGGKPAGKRRTSQQAAPRDGQIMRLLCHSCGEPYRSDLLAYRHTTNNPGHNRWDSIFEATEGKP